MNHRLLITGTSRVGEGARAVVTAALAEITGQPVEIFEERLDDPTPWLLDLPSTEEATALGEWAFQTAGVRTAVVPAVGPPAPSRAAGLALLGRRTDASRREREQAAQAEAEALSKRHEEGRARAAELSTRERRSGPLGVGAVQAPTIGSGLELDERSIQAARDGQRALPIGGLSTTGIEVKADVPSWLRRAAGVALVAGLVWGVGPRVAAAVERAGLHDGVEAGLRGLGGGAAVNERIVRQAVAAALHERGHIVDDFQIQVFVAPDALAAQLEADRGAPSRVAEDGLRLRARIDGRTSFLGRGARLHVDADVLLRGAAALGKVEPYSADFVALPDD